MHTLTIKHTFNREEHNIYGYIGQIYCLYLNFVLYTANSMQDNSSIKQRLLLSNFNQFNILNILFQNVAVGHYLSLFQDLEINVSKSLHATMPCQRKQAKT